MYTKLCIEITSTHSHEYTMDIVPFHIFYVSMSVDIFPLIFVCFFFLLVFGKYFSMADVIWENILI